LVNEKKLLKYTYFRHYVLYLRYGYATLTHYPKWW